MLAPFHGGQGEEPATDNFLGTELGGEIAGLRADIAHFEMQMDRNFRQQRIWVTTVCLVGMTVLVGIVALLS